MMYKWCLHNVIIYIFKYICILFSTFILLVDSLLDHYDEDEYLVKKLQCDQKCDKIVVQLRDLKDTFEKETCMVLISCNTIHY